MGKNVLIRDLPNAVHARLSDMAREQGMSLQQYLTEELTNMAGELTMAEWIAEFKEMKRKYPGEGIKSDDVVREIHAAREERIDAIMEATGWDASTGR